MSAVDMRKRPAIIFSVLFCACAFILLSHLGNLELSGSDEPRYAQVAREMLETGRYILPHNNGEIYPDKPPVLFWLISLASLPGGEVTPFTARLPSALAGLALVLLTFLFAKKLYDPLTGLIAAGVLFTAKEFFDISATVHFDVIFACFTTLALYLYYLGYAAGDGARKYYVLSWSSMGLALLTKGPVGVLIPLITIILFLCVKQQQGRLRELHIGTGLLIAFGMLALWLVPACLIGGAEYTDNIVFKQSFGRTVASFSHKLPFYYYIFDFPLKSLPWSLFLPGACVYFWRTRKAGLNILFPLVWFGATFIFFSAVSCKRSLYLMHLYPPFAMLIAKFWRDAFSRAGSCREPLIKIPLLLLFGGALLAGCGAIAALYGNLEAAQPFMTMKALLYQAAALAICGGILGVVFLWRGNPSKHAAGLIGLMLLAGYYLLGIISPGADVAKPGITFCGYLKTLVGPGDVLIASFQPDYFNFALHRYPIPVIKDDPAALKKMFSSQRKVFYLAKDTEYENAPDELKQLVTVMDKVDVGRRSVVLLGNAAAAGSVK